jgi:uncharacterized protein (DUF2252 family)
MLTGIDFLSQSGAVMRDVVQAFMDYNRALARRNPDLLRFKVARMAAGPFAFLRGTFHVFAQDVLGGAFSLPAVDDDPEVALIGDVHGENFGTFKGADGLIHYDHNDFDETTTGRFELDVCRQAIGLFLTARENGEGLADAILSPAGALMAYVDAFRRLVKKGESLGDPNEQHPCGCPPVDDLIRAGAAAKRRDFVERWTTLQNGKRLLRRSLHVYNVPEPSKARALRLLADYATRHCREDVPADFYEAEDVAGRVSGIGSMGRLRFVLLLRGKGSADGRNVLLEFKEAQPSGYDVARGRTVETLKRAEVVVDTQRRLEASASPYLGYALDGDLSFQARELGPADARVDLATVKVPPLLQQLARVQAQILARAHVRAAVEAVGPSFRATTQSMLEDPDRFGQRILAFALTYADQVLTDYTRFLGARADLENVSKWAGS